MKSWGPWTLRGVRLVHENGAYVCVHREAIDARMGLGHALTWCSPADAFALRAAWKALEERLAKKRSDDERWREEQIRSGHLGHTPRWAMAKAKEAG